MPDFCFHPCANILPYTTTLSLGMALVLQAVIVILNSKGCATCFVLRWYLDMSDMMPKQEGRGFKILHPFSAMQTAGLRKMNQKDMMNLAPGGVISKLSTLASFNAVMQ